MFHPRNHHLNFGSPETEKVLLVVEPNPVEGRSVSAERLD
jgi:hypothetical protein